MKVFTNNIKQKYVFSIYSNNQRIKSLLFFVIILISLCLFSQHAISQEVKLTRELKKTLRKADKQNKKGNYNIAKDNYLYVIEQKPFHINSLIKYANICFKHKHDYKEALDKYERVSPLLKAEISRLEDQYKQKRKTKKRIKFLKENKIQIENKLQSCKSYLNEKHQQENRKSTNRLLENERKNSREINDKQIKNNQIDNEKNNDYSLSEFNSKEIEENWNLTEKNFRTGIIQVNVKDNKQKLEVVKKEVENQFNILKDSSKLFELPYHKITKINQFWLDRIKFQQYDWFEELKSKESYYRDRVDEYNNLLIGKIKLLNESEIINNEINGIRKKISILQQDKERLNYLKQNGLGQELKSRLRTIPKSILLIGRIKHDEKVEKKTLLDKLKDKMIKEAIGQVNGRSILNKKYIEQEEIIQLFEVTSEGIAQISNKFYKPITISFNDGQRTYEICRIEVSPFDEKEIKNDQIIEQKNNDSVFYDIDVYQTSFNDDSTLLKLPNYNKEKIDNHKFKEDELKFIKQENKFSTSLNIAYNDKIKSAITWYNKEKEKTLKKINNNEGLLKQLLIDIDLKQKDSISNILDLETIDLESKKNYEKEIKNSKNEYENFYKNKLQYINNLRVINTEILSADQTYKYGYNKLAEECFKSVSENLTKGYFKTTIYKEVTNNNTLVGFREDVVNYEPIIESFRIITLGNYYEPGKNKRNANLSLNMAFVIKWKPVISDEKNVFPENNHIETKTPEKPLTKVYKEQTQPENSIISKESNKKASYVKPLVAEEDINTPSYEWKCFGTELTSITSYGWDKESDWVIAKEKELKNIISSSRNQRKIIKSFFGSDNWPINLKEIILVTNNSEINKTNNRRTYKAYKIQNNWKNVSTIKVYAGDEVYILLIKD